MRFLPSCLLCLIVGFCAQAQQYPRDTSYTLQSAYKKYVKYYPDIEPVAPLLPKGVQADFNTVYKNTGSRDLHLDIFKPEKIQGPMPLVLLVHGGGWQSGSKELMQPLAMHLAAKGFVTVCVEYRLSLEAPYPAAVYDIKYALKWLRSHAETYHIDAGKMAILGTSAGGQLASLVGTTGNESYFEDESDTLKVSTEVHAIVDIDGVLAFIHKDSDESSVAARWMGGDSTHARSTWLEASALTHANENTPPMLFLASKYPRFLAGRQDVIAILDKHNIYNETHFLEDAPHSFWLFEPWFTPTLQYVEVFLKKVL